MFDGDDAFPMPGTICSGSRRRVKLGGYVPFARGAIRSACFGEKVRADGETPLHVDEDSGHKDAGGGRTLLRRRREAFVHSLDNRVEFLGQIEANRVQAATGSATASPAAAGDRTVAVEAEVGGKKAPTKGLHRISPTGVKRARWTKSS